MTTTKPQPAFWDRPHWNRPSTMPTGTVRERELPGGERLRIRCLATLPRRGASFWVADSSDTPAFEPAPEPGDKLPAGVFLMFDFQNGILPNESDMTDDVKQFTTPKEKQALLAGLRVFQTKECRDPYSNHWEATEVHLDGFIYRGDLPHYRKTELHLHLRRPHRDCLINNQGIAPPRRPQLANR